MHLLNCLLLKLYKHSRRSHCLPQPNPSATILMRVRERVSAREKFKGRRIDVMMLKVFHSLPLDVVRLHLKPAVVGSLKTTKQTRACVEQCSNKGCEHAFNFRQGFTSVALHMKYVYILCMCVYIYIIFCNQPVFIF